LLTQLGTIRLGRRTENWGTTVKEFVQLPEMDDFVFGGWDAFPE
jgi:myo-inositol-1-phosphate synthase